MGAMVPPIGIPQQVPGQVYQTQQIPNQYAGMLRPEGFPVYTTQWPSAFNGGDPTQVQAPIQTQYLPTEAPLFYSSAHWDTQSYLPMSYYGGAYDTLGNIYPTLPHSGSFQYMQEGVGPVIPRKRSTRRRFFKFCC
ncbi:hypothetical protein FG379_003205 [Cryptosporidium bovis]|uniref:uncharacterized protein n=1 Tax=Cryptosporidium bovis TaxID=310047 RepID=UPI00351A9609|nr:hypothetical protein FG379_003205 [Cryptosporidium bovis]